ncbi:MAG TPA: hypothetical protein V6D22_07290 [Candidatus Obscuribacterales bacterium]
MSTKLGGSSTDAQRNTAGAHESSPQYSTLNFLVLLVIVVIFCLMVLFISTRAADVRNPLPPGQFTEAH